MVCHMKYFNINGYFLSEEYVNNMGVDLENGTIGSNNLSDADFDKLKAAIELSDRGSDEKNIAGVINLIQLVESLQDDYHVSHDHKHPFEAVIASVIENPAIVSHYRLEQVVAARTTTETRSTQTPKREMRN
ncbi:MAG: hypothetical protein U9O94_08250 [Nanoarchaeota archaeon]|nr:hypothetical protein [Nanoarchaeota archaeon]